MNNSQNNTQRSQSNVWPLEIEEIRKLLLTQRISSAFKCLICFQVFLDGLECSSCQNICCKSCLERWWEENKKQKNKCPQKCSNGFLNEPHRKIKQLIGEFEMKCPSHKNGCIQLIQLKKLKLHFSECQYYIIQCENKKFGCQQALPRQEIKQHEQQCQYKEWICFKCKEESIIMNKDNHDCLVYLSQQMIQLKQKDQLKEQQIQSLQNELNNLGLEKDQQIQQQQNQINYLKQTQFQLQYNISGIQNEFFWINNQIQSLRYNAYNKYNDDQKK